MPVPLFVIQNPVRSENGATISLGVVLVGSKMVDDFVDLIKDNRDDWFIVSLSQNSEFGKSTEPDLHVFSNILKVEEYIESPAGRLQIPYFISCCGNFIDTDIFYEEPLPSKYDLLCITKTLVTKRIELFIETLRANPDLKGLLITFDMISKENKANSERYRKYIYTLIKQYCLDNLKHRAIQSVEHLNSDGSFVVGELDKKNIRNLINQTKIYLLTSQTEGINRTFAEALSCNIPVIIMDDLVGGTKEIFRKEMGEIAFPNVKSISQKIRLILKNTSKYNPRLSYISERGKLKANENLFQTVEKIIREKNNQFIWKNPRKYGGDLWTKDIYEIIKFN